MKIATFDIGITRGEGEVERVNTKTIIVKYCRAGETTLIKRHIEKHRVEMNDSETSKDK